MDWQQYMARWQEQVGAMDRSGLFTVRFAPDPAVWPEDPEDIERELASEPGMGQVHILDEIRGFYQIANGFSLYWVDETNADTDRKAGASGLAHLKHLSYLYEPAERQERERRAIAYSSLYEDYRTFDGIDGEHQVALRFRRDRHEPEFYYYVKKTRAHHLLLLDFTTYMDLLLESRGLLFWQEFFIADPDARIAPDWAEWFHANLRRLFPDADASRFQR